MDEGAPEPASPPQEAVTFGDSWHRPARRRWIAAAAWTMPLIAVKADLPATVAVIGLLVALRGRRRLSAAMILAAIGSGLIIVDVILPALNPARVYAYAASTAPDGQRPLHRLFLLAIKLRTLLWLLAPTLFLALRSPLLFAAVPTLAGRFWSTNPSCRGTGFQYGAVLMPIAFVAFLDAFATTDNARPARAAAHAACVLALAATMLKPRPLPGLFDPDNWSADAEAQQVRLELAHSPPTTGWRRNSPPDAPSTSSHLYPTRRTPRAPPSFEHLYDNEVSDARTAARVLAVRLHDIAADHAGGLREGFTREQALAELAATSTDPDLLAEAAAAHAIADNWFAITAVGLLIEAGADRELIQTYAEVLYA